MSSSPRWRVRQVRFSMRFGPCIIPQAQGLATERAYMQSTFPCPKCGVILDRSGEIALGGRTLPVFQCDNCTIPWWFDGVTEEVAYTFALTPDGMPFDPAADSLGS